MQHGAFLDQRPALLLVKANARGGIGAMGRLRRLWLLLLRSLLRTRSSEAEGQRQQGCGGYQLSHAVLQTAVKQSAPPHRFPASMRRIGEAYPPPNKIGRRKNLFLLFTPIFKGRPMNKTLTIRF